MSTRTIQKEIKRLLQSVASDLDVPYKTVEDIYIQEFKYVTEMMAAADRSDADSYLNIQLRYLGTFVANHKHIKKLQYIHDDRQLLQGEQLLGSESDDKGDSDI